MIIIMNIRQVMKLLDSRVNTFTPQIESPIKESPIEIVHLGILDNNGPCANTRLTPGKDCQSRNCL